MQDFVPKNFFTKGVGTLDELHSFERPAQRRH